MLVSKHNPIRRLRRALWPLLLLAAALIGSCCLAAPALASAAHASRTVAYRGYRLTVPGGWPVYRLSPSSSVCVRFNRHAVYLGDPGHAQSCPPGAPAGRTEAILVQPLRGAGRALPAPSRAAADVASGSSARIVDRARGVVVTATWRDDPAAIARALGLRSIRALSALASRSRSRPAPAPIAAKRVRGGSAAGRRVGGTRLRASAASVSPTAPAIPGASYSGLGFDACSTPSEATMSAWGSSSPFGAIGVYIGGTNMACSQPNLNASWVSAESQAGWHLVPIYVGLQAPSNSCGCAAISAASASAEGAAAAADAVAQAQALGMGTGNPLYFDMEGYTRSSANTAAVLAFLSAWTTELHAAGYLSGVYSSDASGIADLVAQAGTQYPEPDDIWFANWNNQQNVSDSVVPATEWVNRRLHQYEGAHNDKYGGVTVNVDSDDVDGATAAAGSSGAPGTGATVAAAPPAATGRPQITGTPLAGQTLAEVHGRWSGTPTSYAYQWNRCAGNGSGCTPIPGATAATYTLTQADVGHAVTVTETAANAAGGSGPDSSTATAAVRASAIGFWLFSTTGAVDNSLYEPSFGSPLARGTRTGKIVGMAVDPAATGYWLAGQGGSVYPYGSATAKPPIRVAHLVHGIVAARGGGYWLYTAEGNVYASRGTPFFGSPVAGRMTLRDVTGMAETVRGRGYWLVTTRGTVMAYGAAAKLPALHPKYPITGIVTAPGGYWLYTASGNVYASRGAHFYGSPAGHRIHTHSIVGMTGTPDGKGYWLVTSTGKVYGYGDAASYPVPGLKGAVAGIAGR